ncbi:hypothetical protein IAE40_13230 [Pseudomonas sp. S44]|uniref:hypothetical protein n=1 Tax=Pseudomonas sp. S44 TaxID=2767450 RepID=UPI00190A9736|nr:hypothetical protein [Pseudomonas sp. S44]MBK0059602.1 hypothetical protein [Pseudomonas sp. S44]
MKRTLEGMVTAGEELLRQALDANRRLRQVEADGESPEEVERHRVLADRLYRQVTEHQLIAVGEAPHIIH